MGVMRVDLVKGIVIYQKLGSSYLLACFFPDPMNEDTYPVLLIVASLAAGFP